MKTKTAGLFTSAVLGLALSTSASAGLIDRGNGLIYDDDLDITWTADTNLFAGNWNNAMAWADGLSYGGYDDWRLPTADPNCFGYNCQGSANELGHLFYQELGGVAGGSLRDSTDPDLGLFTGPFENTRFWTGTEDLDWGPLTDYAFLFTTSFGSQGGSWLKSTSLSTWAVRDGDVATVPEPGTLLLLGAGIAGMVVSRRRRCKLADSEA